MFNCGNGSCIDLEKRCNSVIDCEDRTDEIGCSLVSLPEGYDKEVSNSEKSELIFDAEIINILEIDDNLGKIRIIMQLHMQWQDQELEFKNLKNNSGLNVLNEKEYSSIWKPQLILVNKEKDGLEDRLQPHISIYPDDIEHFSFANYDSLYNSKIYSGENIIIRRFSEFRYLSFLFTF